MAKTKVAVTLDTQTLRRVDRLVRDVRYPNRSQAIEAAVAEQLARLEGRRLASFARWRGKVSASVWGGCRQKSWPRYSREASTLDGE